MTWIAPTPTHEDHQPLTGSAQSILVGYLAAQRAGLLNVCAGLTADQMAARSVAPSTLSLLGLVRHLTKVERTWLRIRVAGEDVAPLFPRKDEDFDDVRADDAGSAFAALQAEWGACDTAVRGLPLETTFDYRGQEMSLGSVYAHLIEEYARHNGHADLLRESIDGVTGR
ncbi:MAG TPA: DinB family protein [Mycobacteriales bacterium]